MLGGLIAYQVDNLDLNVVGRKAEGREGEAVSKRVFVRSTTLH